MGKALTIHQPWASMAVLGIKPFEFRKNAVPRSIVGRVVTIHASKRPVMVDEVAKILRTLKEGAGDGDPRCMGLDHDKALHWLTRVFDFPEICPLSAALGTVRIGEAIPAHLVADMADSDRVAHHVMAWPLSEPTMYREPVLCRGFQGFWTYPQPMVRL